MPLWSPGTLPRGSALRRAGLITSLVLALLLPLAGGASACPFCAGGPSGVNEVKETVFGQDFWPNLLAAVAPFAVLLGVAFLLHFGPTPWRGSPAADPGASESLTPARGEAP